MKLIYLTKYNSSARDKAGQLVNNIEEYERMYRRKSNKKIKKSVLKNI